MAYNKAKIRRLITKSFDDQEIRSFCSVYFPGVYEDLSDGMRKSRKVELLLDHCMRADLMPELIDALAHEKPGPIVDDLLAQAPGELTEPEANSEPIIRNPRQIFISHAHQDAELAHWLAEKLNLHGWQSWIAPGSIRPGEKWVEAINRGLAESGVFVLVLSETAVKSRRVKNETNFAIQSELEDKLKFIPLRATPLEIPGIPALWQNYHQVRFDTDRKAGLMALLKELEPEKMVQLEDKYRSFQKATDDGKWEIAQSTGKQIEVQYPDYQDVSSLLLQVKNKIKRLEGLYEQFIEAFDAGRWQDAVEIGKDIELIDNNYRDVKDLRETALKNLENQKKEAQLVIFCEQIQIAFKMKNWAKVLEYWKRIEEIEESYECVPEMVEFAKQRLQSSEHVEVEIVPQTSIEGGSESSPHIFQLPRLVWGIAFAIVLIVLLWGIISALDNRRQSLSGIQTAEASVLVPSDTSTFTSVPTQTVAKTVSQTTTPTPTWTPAPTPFTLPLNPELGSTWTRPTDMMEMVFVPTTWDDGLEGDLTSEGNGQESLQDYQDGFWIDKFEVSNEQFVKFLSEVGNQGEYYGKVVTYLEVTDENATIKKVDGGVFELINDKFSNHPVVEVTWYGAHAYCEKKGGELPTLLQWQHAVGGSDNNPYPWGDISDNQDENTDDAELDTDCEYANFEGCVGSTQPVGSYLSPAGKDNNWIGIADMAGNVWEWLGDSQHPESSEEVSTSATMTLIGGSWANSKTSMDKDNYFEQFRDAHESIYGFRCVVHASR